MGIIKQHDKRSGITYVYESVATWDPVKKQSRAKRKLIGRLDPQTGEIVPTDGRNRRKKADVKKPEEPDYKVLYEKLQKQCAAQKTLIEALQKELCQWKEKEK